MGSREDEERVGVNWDLRFGLVMVFERRSEYGFEGFFDSYGFDEFSNEFVSYIFYYIILEV